MEFILVAEGPSDVDISKDLVDRVLHAEPPDWLRMGELEGMRTWSGLQPDEEYTRWRNVGDLYDEMPRMPDYLGHERGGQSNNYDYAAARRVMLITDRLARNGDRPIRAVVLIRDTDTQKEERTQSLENARGDHDTDDYKVVIGIACPKIEAWILNGFEPQTDDESEHLQEERQRLPVDPLTEAHELTASSDDAQNNCKRVANGLTNGEEERKRACWKDTDLSLLRERGTHTGLSDFLDDVNRLIPIFTDNPPPQAP
jgi:hypothetical protein